MPFLEFFEKNWAWLNLKPWAALGLAILSFSLGWMSAQVWRRISEAREGSAGSAPSSTEIIYPLAGSYGKNILANSVKDVYVNENVSLRAEIPPGTRLHIEFHGPGRNGQLSTGAWGMRLPYRNWISRDYDDTNGARQNFDAEPGVAELQITFYRVGEVTITATEGVSSTPNWSKTIRVNPAP